MHIDAGRLDKHIEFLRRAPERDAEGYALPSEPEVVRRCWAQYSQTSGSELIRAGAEMGETKVRFLIRSCADVLDRRLTVRYSGREYDIEYINTYGDRGEYMEVWCKRRTKEGMV